MTSNSQKLVANLSGLNAAAWIDRLEDLADDHGFFEPLGPDHSAAFIQGNKSLLVCFEDAEIIRRETGDAEPRGFRFHRAQGWSVLSVVSEGESWFRHPAVYDLFDRLTDEGFFEEFDQVLFHGVSAAGYAAAAYSVASPGANVLLVRPQATLDPEFAGFDARFVRHRRQDFNSRYGYAPDMIEAAAAAWLIYDPRRTPDAVHAALFRRPCLTPLRARGAGPVVENVLDSIRIHDQLIVGAMDGTLSGLSFARAYRARREWPNYARNLLRRLSKSDHPRLAATLCRFMQRNGPNPYFDDELEALALEGHHPLLARHAPAAE